MITLDRTEDGLHVIACCLVITAFGKPVILVAKHRLSLNAKQAGEEMRSFQQIAARSLENAGLLQGIPRERTRRYMALNHESPKRTKPA